MVLNNEADAALDFVLVLNALAPVSVREDGTQNADAEHVRLALVAESLELLNERQYGAGHVGDARREPMVACNIVQNAQDGVDELHMWLAAIARSDEAEELRHGGARDKQLANDMAV